MTSLRSPYPSSTRVIELALALLILTLITPSAHASWFSRARKSVTKTTKSVARAVKRSPAYSFHPAKKISNKIKSTGEFFKCTTSRSGKKIHWYNKINPKWWAGNIDDDPPADYHPGEKSRNLRWAARNPFHNFTFYVAGMGDKTKQEGYTRTGKYPNNVFNPNGGSNYATSSYNGQSCGFYSYRGNGVKFYAGCRESGNVGFKLTKDKDGQ